MSLGGHRAFVFLCIVFAAGTVGWLFAAEGEIPPARIVIDTKSDSEDKADTGPSGGAVSARHRERTSRLDILGCWLIVDRENGNAPESVVYFYTNPGDGLVYCKMLTIFDDQSKMSDTLYKPLERAKGIKGSPYLCGMDFIFGLAKGRQSYSGHVINPDTGSVYRCEVWFDMEKKLLVVRGELLIFGKNEYWEAFDEKKLPFDISKVTLAPNTPFARGR